MPRSTWPAEYERISPQPTALWSFARASPRSWLHGCVALRDYLKVQSLLNTLRSWCSSIRIRQTPERG